MLKFREYIKESPSDLKKPGQKKTKLKTDGKKKVDTKVKKGTSSQKNVSKKLKVIPQMSMS